MSVITRSKQEYPEGFDVDSFESLRKKLLDISGRNRLLNLKHTMKSFVRIIDEAPDQLSDILLKDEFVQFLPVPTPSEKELIETGFLKINEDTGQLEQVKAKPSATEWAKHLGFDIEYDLSITPPSPQEKHNDKRIQSVIFEEDLNTRLKKLYSESKTSREETGNNILFLCFGSLEYQDSTNGWGGGTTATRSAPLFLIPVEITKQIKKGLVVFELNYSGEDIITNLTLKEKLSHDFGIRLPDVYDDDDELKTPEVYFNEVTKLLKKKKNDPLISKWKLKRYGTLCTLSLGKLLMYRDLDPSNWPNEGQNLTNHEIVKRFFNSSHNFSDSTRDIYEDYTLDDVDQLHHHYPMVEDADSSQMSSLIDVMEGKNLVIEGPPGTGKSQTITNIIATAMSQKKSILFVAEKQAALDVVKNRLDNIGLGDFCLDIHSDKIQKKKVHESLKTRIDNQPSYHFDEVEFNSTLQFLQSKQLELQHYVQEINSKWEGTDKTIQEILMAAARYQNEVNQEDFNHYPLEPINNGNLASYQISQIISSFKSYYEFSEKVKSQILELNGEKAHPWTFVNNSDLTNKDEATIKMKLEELIATIESIEQLIEKINTSYIDELDIGNTPEQIKNIVLPITNIKIPHEIVQLRLINELNESTQVKLNESYSACQKILASKDQLIQLVNHNSLANLENLIEDIQQIQYIQEFGID